MSKSAPANGKSPKSRKPFEPDRSLQAILEHLPAECADGLSWAIGETRSLKNFEPAPYAEVKPIRATAFRHAILNMEEEKSHLDVRWVAAAGIVVIVLALVWWWISLPKVGQIFVIRPDDQSRTIYFPLTTQAASELVNLTQAGDKVGLATLVLEERILVLAAGTRVVVTRHSWVHSLYQVQVLEGNLAMKTGWVPGRILSRPRAGAAISPR